MQAFCSNCQTMRELTNAQVIKTSDDKRLTRGSCAVCGAALMRLGAAQDDQERKTTDRPTTNVASPSLAQNANPEQPVLIPSADSDQADSQVQTPSTRSPAKKSSLPRRRARARDQGDDAETASGGSPSSARDAAALVIVESPAKAKTVGKFLGRSYRVRASVGHIRDLPTKGMGVDLEHNFKPQ